MSEKNATINIVVSASGVERIQFCGEDWSDEDEATRLYNRVKPLIRQMDRLLKSSSSPTKGVVQ